MSDPKIAHLVSHTHWDREWYRTFHEFRVRLVRIVREVLDRLEEDPSFEHFLLDGQAVLLEDHLEVHPEDGPRIRRLVEAGALALGPWYVLPDEFLVSAEAHVRNLLVGKHVSAPLGGAQTVGYMPDSFGHVAQMPQILRRAGLDSFVFTRGQGDEADDLGWTFRWAAPDGSEVVAVNQADGYCNAGGLGHEELWHAHTIRTPDPDRAVEKVRELFARMAARRPEDVVLLNNGCDHFPPQAAFGEILAALGEGFPETTFRHVSLREHVDAARRQARDRHEGELLGGRDHPILSGVWSARLPLKQANDRAQTWLAQVAEPAAAAARFLHGRPYPHGLLLAAWKELLKNHPHDSICGCSTDEVHRDMEPRFAAAERTAREVVAADLEALAPSFGARPEDDRDTVIAVLNPIPARRDAVLDRLVVLQPFGDDLDRLGVVDENGRPVPFEVLDRRLCERFWGIDYRAMLDGESALARFGVYLDRFGDRMIRGEDRAADSDAFLHLRFLARDLPAVGHARFSVRETDEAPAPIEDPVRVERHTMENAKLAVTLHADGTFAVTDKASGEVWAGLGLLEDEADIGDEYDFSYAKEPGRVTSAGADGRVEAVEPGGLRGALATSFLLELPAAATEDRKGRTADTVLMPVRVTVSLDAGSALVDLDVRVDNLADDHRLRVRFPTPLAADTVLSDGHFAPIRRTVERPAGEGWVQPPPATVPQLDWSAVEEGGRGLAVLVRGLPEVEAFREDGRTGLAVTLLRAVGWLSRDDFPTRNRMNAGPTIPTPEAQCPGEHRFRLAVMPFAGDAIVAGVDAASQAWRIPCPTKQGVVAPSTAGGTGLVATTSGRTRVTAIKRHEAHESLVVRLVNLTGENVEEALDLGLSDGSRLAAESARGEARRDRSGGTATAVARARAARDRDGGGRAGRLVAAAGSLRSSSRVTISRRQTTVSMERTDRREVLTCVAHAFMLTA
jgi:mannosylglycerate hydrolase